MGLTASKWDCRWQHARPAAYLSRESDGTDLWPITLLLLARWRLDDSEARRTVAAAGAAVATAVIAAWRGNEVRDGAPDKDSAAAAASRRVAVEAQAPSRAQVSWLRGVRGAAARWISLPLRVY